MKLARRISLGLLVLVLLTPSALLYWIVTTEAGLRFVTSHLGTIGPVTITVENASGTFADGFKVGMLRIQHRRVDIRITNAEGRLRLLPLLQRKIELRSGTAQQVSVQVFHVDDPTPSGPLRFMPDTLSVEADALQADQLVLITMGGNKLLATNISTAADVLPQVIRIKGAKLDWQDMQMHLTADGRLHAKDPIGFDGRASIDWTPDGMPAWRFDTAFDGDLDKLPLRVDISKPFHAHVDGAATRLADRWQLTGNGTTSDLDINVFGGGTALGIMSAKVAILVDGNGFAAKGPVIAPGLASSAIDVDFHGAYANHRLTIRESTAVHKPSGSHGTVHGTVDVVPHGPRLALAGKWTTLQWPLVSTAPAFTSSAGNYSIEGIRPWKARADGRISAAGLSDLPASATGTLDVDSFTIDDGAVALYGGNAKVKGSARWAPAQSWNVAGHIAGLDVSKLRTDVPGTIDFDFRASGAPFGDAGSIDFALSQLSGKLRGKAAGGSGRFTRAGGSDNWQFHQVDLHLGKTRIQLDGSLAAPRDLKFAVDADDLSLLDETARGKVSASGHYAGTDDAPVLALKAHGTGFEWQGYQVDALDTDIDLDLGDNGHAQGKVDLTGIHHDNYTVREAQLDLTGTGKAQHATLTVDARPLRAVLTAAGELNARTWRGTIDSLKVNDDQDLSLQLERPTPLMFDMQRAELGDLCVKSDKARGCINGKRETNGLWSAALAVEAMPLRAFTAGLTQDIDYEGTINLKGNIAGGSGTLPTGSVSGELMQAQLLHTLSNGRVEPLSLGTGTLQATATATGFSAEVALNAGATGSINGKLSGQRNTSNWQDYPITGELDARTDGLALLDIYVGGIDKATGQLDTRVDITGTLGNPAVAGRLQLKDASIDVYQVGGSLRDVSLDAHFDAHTLELTGQSRLGDGIAHFDGKLAWRDNEPYGNLHLEQQGDKPLLVVDVPEARIEISPKLDFKLAGHRIDATGEVLIPRAKLEPADLTNAVLASDDEVLVGAEPVDPKRRWTVFSNIKLTLGDDVNIKSLGLTASLGGSITVRTDDSPVSRGQGELVIKSGKYMAYGRLLDIDRGRLIFNGPLNDPSVDARAQKTFLDVTGDITAGVNVRGPLRSPRLTFYSEPSLPQSQIASLILAGGSVDSVQNRNNPGAARNELLTQAGALLGQRVGTRIGIDDIGVESDISNLSTVNVNPNASVNSDTSLVLGKYLSPRLYVSYGISLAEAINTFKMRFTLGKGWTIRTEAGKARSADIVYTIKKGKKPADDKKAAPSTTPKQPTVTPAVPPG
ncbi:MAG: translocation/assembly module TamB domain-containing protein [Pseudomonadota bacterium]